jgi:hypothetical protein
MSVCHSELAHRRSLPTAARTSGPREVFRGCSGLPGVEAVLNRAEAAKADRLVPERIGDLAVLGDADTVSASGAATSPRPWRTATAATAAPTSRQFR